MTSHFYNACKYVLLHAKEKNLQKTRVFKVKNSMLELKSRSENSLIFEEGLKIQINYPSDKT